MPYIQTKGNQHLTLSYEPTPSLVKRGKAVAEMLSIGPEPVEVTQDQAQALVGTNPESLRYSDDQHLEEAEESPYITDAEIQKAQDAANNEGKNTTLIDLQAFINNGGAGDVDNSGVTEPEV